jgi:para-nitrobenzyl esterase
MAGAVVADRPAVAVTASGQVRGEQKDDLVVWRGIPYARAPAGDLRFRPPQPPEAWAGIRSATTHGPVAWQADSVNPFTGQPVELNRSEDCLYLNVTAPAGPAPDPAGYPVLLWVHGGGYSQGEGAGDLVADGAGLARRGLVVVTFNYRLGSLGFLQLGAEAGPGYGESGRAGFLDQVAALRWVHASIAGFGGDPARITAYGVSAGAKSVANLLASPLTRGLISRAISASGGGEHIASPDDAARLRHRLLAELGLTADDASRLPLVPAPALIAAQEAIGSGPAGTWIWRPALGGAGIPVLPVQAIGAGAAAGIPLLIGHNGNEGATYQLTDSSAADQAPRVLTEYFGAAAAAAMLAAYQQARPDLDETGVRVAVLGAERYGIPTLRLARAQAAHGPVWRYRYDGCPPGLPAQLAGGHGLDMVAVWAADGLAGLAERGDRQAALGLAMADAWARFARGESLTRPSGGLPGWPAFSAPDEPTMILGAEPEVQLHPRPAEDEIWQGRSWQSGTWWRPAGL